VGSARGQARGTATRGGTIGRLGKRRNASFPASGHGEEWREPGSAEARKSVGISPRPRSAQPIRLTAKVPATETSAGQAGPAGYTTRCEGQRQLPDKLKTCRHEEAEWREPGSAEARKSVGISPRPRSAQPIRLTAKVPAKETSAGPAGPAGNTTRCEGQRQLPDKLKTCRHEEAEWREPGSAEARRALEFRPARFCTANTPHGEIPREGDFCRPGGPSGEYNAVRGAASTPGQVKNLPPRRGRMEQR